MILNRRSLLAASGAAAFAGPAYAQNFPRKAIQMIQRSMRDASQTARPTLLTKGSR